MYVTKSKESYIKNLLNSTHDNISKGVFPETDERLLIYMVIHHSDRVEEHKLLERYRMSFEPGRKEGWKFKIWKDYVEPYSGRIASTTAGKQESCRGVFEVREIFIFYMRPIRSLQYSS